MSKHLSFITIIPLLLVIFLLPAGITVAEEQPLWWEQAEAEARRGGYHLITLDTLESLYQSGKDFIILDVRPDYEYKRAHLPRAANLEFHLGERLTLDPAKQKEFEALLGPNKDQTIVIYCRSFRWLRSGIASRWAVRLGYNRVHRLPHGYFGWRDVHSSGEELPETLPQLTVGDFFPSCHLVLLSYSRDKEYLQIQHHERTISLEDIQSEFILIELYNEYCHQCLKEVKEYKALYANLAEDNSLQDKIKMMGIGVGSKKRQVAKFRKQQNIDFPLFADEKSGIFACLGKPDLPTSYLVQRSPKGGRKIILVQSGHIRSRKVLMEKVRSLVRGEHSAISKQQQSAHQ